VADRDRVGLPCRSFSHVCLLINGLTHMHLWFVHVQALPVGAGELGECVVGCAVPGVGPVAVEGPRSGLRWWPSGPRSPPGDYLCMSPPPRRRRPPERCCGQPGAKRRGASPTNAVRREQTTLTASAWPVGTVWCIGVDVAGLSARRVRPSLCTRLSLPPLRCAAGWPRGVSG
jgi:hypothetical protein